MAWVTQGLFFFPAPLCLWVLDMGPWLPAYQLLKGAQIPAVTLGGSREPGLPARYHFVPVLSVNRALALRGVDCRDPQ